MSVDNTFEIFFYIRNGAFSLQNFTTIINVAVHVQYMVLTDSCFILSFYNSLEMNVGRPFAVALAQLDPTYIAFV